jgi:hypothetical protein
MDAEQGNWRGFQMKKFVMLIIVAMLMVGCATERIVYVDRPVEVLVPVPVDPPEPMPVNEPFLPVWLLGPENISDPDKIAIAYVKSLIILESYANRLQCALDTYRKETPKLCKNPETVEENVD